MKMKKMLVILFCVFILTLTLGLNAGKKGPENEGYWMPDDPEAIAKYLNKFREKVKKERGVSKVCEAITELSPVMQEFKNLIYCKDPVVRMYFTQMIDQIPGYYKENDPQGYLESIDEMLVLINAVLTTAPEFNETDLVGFPINAILDWTMGVPAGFDVFRHVEVNRMFKKILNVWYNFLNSPESLYVLNDSSNGWMCEAAKKAIKIWEFQHDPKAPHWGFKSWNEFFTRKFKKGMRPIAFPKKDKIIVSACESEVFQIAKNVKRNDWFWVKSQPYSLEDMLTKDKKDKKLNCDQHYKTYVEPFIGGVVYQAFLSATKYHRWHSPVSGTIKAAYNVDGTYYSEAESQGMDPAGPNLSQGYIAHVAARALIFIDAKDPVGLMCVIPIGMAEVSSCHINDYIVPGYEVKKGEELGYFQYGGFSHCLVFRPGVIKEFKHRNGKEIKIGDNIKVREMIAEAN
jgi:phosphatidylserine decarboxylase